MTHDFDFFRSLLVAKNSAWGASLKKRRKGESAECAFPAVEFAEVYGYGLGVERVSRWRQMPLHMRKHTSEYAYLFSELICSAELDNGGDRIHLMPNVARRVIEIFLAFKVPDQGKFDQRLSQVAKGPHRDVYDFCNTGSHGEVYQAYESAQQMAVLRNIRRCLEFMYEVDADHFEKMCKAVDHDLEVSRLDFRSRQK
ncbi:hypothetical protein BJF82_00260 [Kytococcus sp. CUA-901]|nr:hypothetical protein BJF82_00260 [Kytococcus sp. CUA-901]